MPLYKRDRLGKIGNLVTKELFRMPILVPNGCLVFVPVATLDSPHSVEAFACGEFCISFLVFYATSAPHGVRPAAAEEEVMRRVRSVRIWTMSGKSFLSENSSSLIAETYNLPDKLRRSSLLQHKCRHIGSRDRESIFWQMSGDDSNLVGDRTVG